MKIALGEILPWTFRTFCLFLGGLGVLALARVSGSTLAIPIAELRPLILVALLNITGWHLIYAEEKERVKEDRIEINYLRGLIFPKGRCGH